MADDAPEPTQTDEPEFETDIEAELEPEPDAEASPKDLLVINGLFDQELLQLVRDEVAEASCTNVLVVICTFGGDPHTGYRVGRLLQNRYEHITMLIGGPCKSTGTLVATAAHELVMSDDGELGPLDVQLWKHGEIYGAQMTSSSILFQALGRVTLEAQDLFRQHMLDMCLGARLPAETAAPVAASMISGLLSPIFAQMDPHQLGEVARANDIGLHYAQRLGTHSKNLKPNTPILLAWTYPDHGFVIDRAEAKGDLFNKVREPNQLESFLLDKLGDLAKLPGQTPMVRLFPGQPDVQQDDFPTGGADAPNSQATHDPLDPSVTAGLDTDPNAATDAGVPTYGNDRNDGKDARSD